MPSPTGALRYSDLRAAPIEVTRALLAADRGGNRLSRHRALYRAQCGSHCPRAKPGLVRDENYSGDACSQSPGSAHFQRRQETLAHAGLTEAQATRGVCCRKPAEGARYQAN
jgi:hypothetical protein